MNELEHAMRQTHTSRTRGAGLRPCYRPAGFTLVELLVVIAIIGILIALLMPAVQSGRESSRTVECRNKLRQLATAMKTYASQNGTLPAGEIHGTSANPGYNGWGGKDHCEWDGQIGIWNNLIFPHIDQQNAYDMLDFNIRKQWKSPANQQVMKMKFSIFLCPSDSYEGLTTDWGVGGGQNKARICNYYAVAGSNEGSSLAHPDGTVAYGHCNKHDGAFYNDSGTPLSTIRDGESNTALLCESWGRIWPEHSPPAVIPPGYPNHESSRGMNLHTVVYLDWAPNTNHRNPWKANSFHNNGVYVAFGDASVRFVTEAVELDVFKGLATLHGGEVLDASKL